MFCWQFCTGDACVDGQIPYTNFDDWLRFEWSTTITEPGNPPIHSPPFDDRSLNADDWDPHWNSPCAFLDGSLCLFDNSPQEPPDADSENAPAAFVQQTSAFPKFTIKSKLGLTHKNGSEFKMSGRVNLTNPYPFGQSPHQPANVPPPVFINHGQTPVPLNLTFGNPPLGTPNATKVVRRSLPRPVPAQNEKRAKVPANPYKCKGSTDTPNPLPTLTYYCDYLPEICANIRDSGFLTNDEMELTYDPFNDKQRRKTVCTSAQTKAMKSSGSCDPLQHDPGYWKVRNVFLVDKRYAYTLELQVSCDEFPFNMALEGGSQNGAVVRGVPAVEQAYQATLNSAVTWLLTKQNDATTQWKLPKKLASQHPGMCHKFVIKLVDTRPANSDPTAVGELDTGGAWLSQQNQGFVKIITDRRAVPPPPPLAAPRDYLPTDTHMSPFNGYSVYDCSPKPSSCATTPSPTPVLGKRQSNDDCTVPALPTETAAASADANSRAQTAATAAAAAAAGKSHLWLLINDTISTQCL